MHYFKFVILVGAVGFIAAPALSQTNTMNRMHNAMAGHTLNVVLGELNKSGQKGWAKITDVSGGIRVEIGLKGEPAHASEPTHIHKGTCAKIDPAPYKALSNVVNGKSTTTVRGMTVADIKKGRYAINVHKSAAELTHYVACGDL